ncbi:MAG: hypothetical protein B1H08_02030 [Candidatus Omnitrophica bacterium 4484_171]|nr:MAG: hypothetical protein B1H08_02030 [Candidatus Omnitrophica bacterium 4484_171]
MLLSKVFIPTLREDPKMAECISHKLMLKAGLVSMISSGIYTYLPLGLIILRKIENIIRRRMNEEGAVELLMSALQPLEIWQQTGRDETLKEVMLKVKDRRKRELCLGPTHEEEITEIAKRFILSYKQMPLILYQIQTKFRDEARPRFGLIRSCEFIMKDAYSFDSDEEGLNISYEKMLRAYDNIFRDMSFDFVRIEADPGAMGGNFSHEFMVPAEIGEDVLCFCPKCGKYYRSSGECRDCGIKLIEKRMIEIGHIFKLGTKYSSAQSAYFLDSKGKRRPVIMGCYGIGVSRIMPAIIEQSHDSKGIVWPPCVSAFDASLLVLERENDFLYKEAFSLYEKLTGAGFDILFDERAEPAGVKFNDAYLIGSPYIIIIGKKYKGHNKFELEVRKTGEKHLFAAEQLINFLKESHNGS